MEFDYPKSGPADIFALGAPHGAKVVDHIPGPELEQILAAMRAGREKMDAYSGLIVEGGPLEEWFEASITYRVWRSGNKWRIEQCVQPPPQWRDAPGKARPSRSATYAAQLAWWMKTAEKLRFLPVIVSDGKTNYRFKIKFPSERVINREDWEKQRYEVESVAPDSIPIPRSDFGPNIILLPEYIVRPPMGIPDESDNAVLDPAPKMGPAGTILLSVDTGRRSATSTGERLWVDPRRGYMAMREEEESGLNGNGESQISVRVIDEAAQSPSGVWYRASRGKRST